MGAGKKVRMKDRTSKAKSGMKVIEWIIDGIELVNEWAGRISSFLIPSLMVVVTYEVLMRYLINRPTVWSFEMSQFLFAGFVALGGAYTFLHHGHVHVEVIVSRLSERGQAIIRLFSWPLFFFFMIFFLTKMWELSLESLFAREHSNSLFDPPVYPMKISIAVGVSLMLLQGIIHFCRDLWLAFAGKKFEGAKEPK
jgi:TRAP-type mannitol/chloroaromatic compound transport system permease small subunit